MKTLNIPIRPTKRNDKGKCVVLWDMETAMIADH